MVKYNDTDKDVDGAGFKVLARYLQDLRKAMKYLLRYRQSKPQSAEYIAQHWLNNCYVWSHKCVWCSMKSLTAHSAVLIWVIQ